MMGVMERETPHLLPVETEHDEVEHDESEEALEHDDYYDDHLDHHEEFDDPDHDEETARLSRRFVAGLVLIVLSLVLGKLVLIPLLLFPESQAWRVGSIVAYLVTWVMLVPGLALSGMEGYRLASRLYKDYRRRALRRVRAGGALAARGAVKVVRTPVAGGRKVALGAVKVARRPVEGGRKVARGAVRVVKKPLDAREKRRDES